MLGAKASMTSGTGSTREINAQLKEEVRETGRAIAGAVPSTLVSPPIRAAD